MAIDKLTGSGGKVNVTIPEGEDRVQIAATIKDLGLSGDYLAASKSFKGFDPNKYGAKNPKSLEGFLFPATYQLDPGSSVDQLVSEQLQAFQQNIAGVDLSYAKSKNLTVYDVLTIASMIDKEVQIPSERPLVAAVIYNRLHRGMPLQIDATTRFQFHNYTGDITESQLQSPSRFNTRINAGLPPDPDRQPGSDAIKAAARPAKVNYLYYVLNGNNSGPPLLHRQWVGVQPAGRGIQLGVTRHRTAGVEPLMNRLAVLGHPVSHSRSPAMQSAALEALGLSGEWSYEAIDVDPAEFDERTRALPGRGFAGVNVTIPHKEAALAVADEASRAAQAIGAANTLSFGGGPDQGGEHRRHGPAGGAAGGRWAGRRSSCWAPVDRLARRSGPWPERVPWSRFGTGRVPEPTSWSATSPSRAGTRPRRDASRRSAPIRPEPAPTR